MSQQNTRALRPEDNFNMCLKKGSESEQEFMRICPLPLIHTASKTTPDFRLEEAGLNLELKADNKISKNMYIEFRSSYGTPGGVYQAKAMGAHVFIYWFRKEHAAYYFWVDALIARIENLKDTLETRRVYSHDDCGNEWYNEGYLLPKAIVEDIRLKRSGDLKRPFVRKIG